MIKPEDLRIGNYVFDNLGGILKIKGISTDSDLSHIKPIPLTERILLDSKFEHHKQIDKCYIITNDIVISFADDKIRVICGNFICQVVVTEIKSIHEFQNTIYSLTKTELIINL